MGIPTDAWANRRKSLLIASPAEDLKRSGYIDPETANSMSIKAGLKAAAIAGSVAAVPTLIAVRKFPWAKAAINPTGQALIISAASIAAFAVTADKTGLEIARRNNALKYTRIGKDS